MKLLSRTFIAAAGLFAITASSQASIVITFSARTVADQLGVALPAGTLVQLVNLGADGVFNQINVGDGSITQLTQWVSGDDSLVNAAYLITGGAPGDFPTAAAFDMVSGTDSIAGRVSRLMEFQTGVVPSGTKLGIRFFPAYQATNFNGITLQAGDRYGEFTRQSGPLYGGDLWVAPSEGSTVSFDGYKSPEQTGGLDPAVAGQSTFIVVPEPASASLLAFAALGLLGFRRRK